MLSLHAPLHQITSFLVATLLLFLCPHLTVAYIYDIKVISCQYKLYPMMIHPFLLSPALKCLNMDQFCKDQPEICVLTCHVVYISNTYSHPVSRSLKIVFRWSWFTLVCVHMSVMYILATHFRKMCSITYNDVMNRTILIIR